MELPGLVQLSEAAFIPVEDLNCLANVADFRISGPSKD